MSTSPNVHRRQIWAVPSITSSTVTPHCTPFTLPSYGVLTIDQTSTITLTTNAVFHPECTVPGDASVPSSSSSPSGITDLRDPFYASTLPQTYVIAAATVISYMLVIMLLITPRTFFVGGAGGGNGFLGRRGMISGPSGSTSVVGVGRRPWLQKVATLTVAISLTIATADTFSVAQRQYDTGNMNAAALRDEVEGGLEIRTVRVISDTFLWLAQVQTLIRLFPRHKEKVIIKWTGFALIILDTIFSILDSFVDNTNKSHPRSYVDAIPALSYLFDLALSLLYAAWVLYYSLCKRRFAFYHSKMRNICLVAAISVTAVLIPFIFFVLDISKSNVATWGDYIRWVGAAAASVVVWEWVERIEALERDERKDGILGREIFDGDEMLEVTPSEEVNWPGNRTARGGDYHGGGRGSRGGGGPDGGHEWRMGNSTGWNGTEGIADRQPGNTAVLLRDRRSFHGEDTQSQGPWHVTPSSISTSRAGPPAAFPNRPPAVASPVSRADSTSAASTIYAVHYHPVSESTPPIPEHAQDHIDEPSMPIKAENHSEQVTGVVGGLNSSCDNPHTLTKREHLAQTNPSVQATVRWQAVSNPFKRRRASPPPPEVASVSVSRPMEVSGSGTSSHEKIRGGWSLRSRATAFAINQSDKVRGKPEGKEKLARLPITVIPAQPRGRTWSPEVLHNSLNAGHHDEDDVNLAARSVDRSKGKAVDRSTAEEGRGREEEPTRQHDRAPLDSVASGPSQPVSPYARDILRNQVLSQRGCLMISEDRHRHIPT